MAQTKIDESSGDPPPDAPDSTAQPPPAMGALGRAKFLAFNSLDVLRIRPYRYMWIGSLLGMGTFQMQNIARTILVDDLTGSALITSIVAMGFAPSMLILSLFGGVAGDRLERRMVIQASQAMNAMLVLVIAILIAAGLIHWWHLLVASVFQGASFAFQMPARQAIIPKLVGEDRITKALALNAAGMGIMTIIAPAVAGGLYGKYGPEAVYFVVAGAGALAVLMTGMILKVPPEPREKAESVIKDISMGVRYMASNRILMLLMLSGLSSALIAMPFRNLIPIFARRMYDSDASEIGWLMATMGVGGLLATVIIANLRRGHHRGMVMVLGGIGLTGISILLLVAFPNFEAGLAVMVLVGLAGSIRMTLGQSLMIELADQEYRARVMSLNMMAFGLMPLGAIPIGRVIDARGASDALLGMGVILLAVTALLLILGPSLRRFS
jgi:MFS family permease